MAKIGYARVSTKEQSLDSQIDVLEKEGCVKIFKEKASGRKTDRTELTKCMEYLRKGDVLVVSKLDRLGRNTRQLIEFVEDLEKKGIEFMSISNQIDTTTAQGKFFFTVMSAFAQMEADLNSERTKAGLESARARGRNGGRPKMDKAVLDKAIRLYHTKEYTIREITEMTGVSKAKLYMELNERKVHKANEGK